MRNATGAVAPVVAEDATDARLSTALTRAAKPAAAFIVFIAVVFALRLVGRLVAILVVAAATIGFHKVLAATGTQHVIGSEINIIRRHCAHHPHPPATAQDEEPIDQAFLMKDMWTTIVG